jgi:hypothetical protein
MNLTTCFVAGMCLSALTASAVELKANAFETGEAGTGWTFDGVKDWDTAGVRFDGDASLEGYTAARPMTGVTSNKVLKLDTEGGVWTNTIGQSFATTPIFADMLVKFVPSEELPTLTDGKLAIAIKLALDGTNYLNVANNTGSGFDWAVTAQAISTSAWYRVTVKMFYDEGLEAAQSQVFVNGNAVGGALTINSAYLNSIGFQGTGFIDEVVVRTDSPFEVTFGAGGPVVQDPEAFDTWLELPGNEGLTRENVQSDEYNAFLMGVKVDPTWGSPKLVVDSFTVGATATITLKAQYETGTQTALGSPLNNGAEIILRGKVSLSDLSWSVNLGSDLSDFDPLTYNFFKVEVAIPAP